MASGHQGEDGPEDDPEDASAFSLPELPFNFDLRNVDFSELAASFVSGDPLNWRLATDIANAEATRGEDEPAIDPDARSQIEELAHAAQTHVATETGQAAMLAAPVQVIDRREWTAIHLAALKTVLERLATTFGSAIHLEGVDVEDLEIDAPPEVTAVIRNLLPVLPSVLLGVQAGSMVGHLARHALGRYDLPLPVTDDPSLSFVVRNIDEFEADWSLDRTDLRFYVAIHEVAHATERSVPWVRQQLVTLANEYVSGYEVDPTILEARLGHLDPSDPESFKSLMAHPDELLGAIRSDRQTEVLQRARVLHAVLDGYADVILERVGNHLIPSFDQIHEAMARHRLERGQADRFVEGLLGLATDREDYERGAAFCAGVIERSGIDALHRLWERPEMAPTPNDFDAPGLWLARIELLDK